MTTFNDYVGHFKMCLITPESKRPFEDDWVNKPYSEPVNGYDHGLIHEHSCTCAIDIDDLEKTRELASERGINIDMLLMMGIQISSGRINRGKLIYRLPFPMQSKKIAIGGKDVINFRCKGNQDVLPPSIHPDTRQPYTWIGDFRNLQPLPAELYEWWAELLTPKVDTTSIPANDPGVNEVRKLLNFCNPDCSRMEWVSIGFAVHSFNPNYFPLWHEWSARATEQGKYVNEQDCYHQWKSFKSKEGGITGKSLYFYAVKGGYAPSLEQALGTFKELDNIDDEYIFEKRYIPELPLDVIPETLREYAEEIAYKIGADPIVPIAAGLTALCTAVDSRSRLLLQPGYQVPPVLWNIVVAPPAAKKSPASKPMFTPFKQFEAEDLPRYKEESKRFIAVQSAWASAQKNHLKMTESAEWVADGMDMSQLPVVPDAPKEPVQLRFTIADATSQKVVDLAEQRPEGISLILDEGKSWLSKICDPRSSEDRSFWTVSYESDRYTFDRVNRGSISIENLAISTYINVQPNVLSKVLKPLEEDGLFQRFTPFIVPSENCSNISNELPEYMSKQGIWESTLRQIKSAGVVQYELSTEARAEFRKFEIWIHEQQQDHIILGSPFGLQSAIGKMLGLCGRYTLVFHVGNDPTQQIVPIERVKDAIRFCKEYIIYTLRYVSLLGSKQPLDEWIFDWMITGEEDSFSIAMLKNSSKKQLEKLSAYEQQRRIENSLSFLEELNIIMEIEKGTNRTATYAINPTIRDKYRDRRNKVIKAKIRQRDDREQKAYSSRGVDIKRQSVRGEKLLQD